MQKFKTKESNRQTKSQAQTNVVRNQTYTITTLMCNYSNNVGNTWPIRQTSSESRLSKDKIAQTEM